MASRTLKKGFTTGAAAAAAAKAATLAHFFPGNPASVEITFLTNEKKQIDIYALNKISETCHEAIVIKDAGDDPDITHKAKIGARVTFTPSPRQQMEILGGKGVGRVTKPGLELPVGEPAINPGPRTMIRNSVNEVLATVQHPNQKITVEIFVPDGEELAKKTLNARLGILGGISILGTTGVVTPMSHDAYIATIKAEISVAAANNRHTLVFTTGRRSERHAMEKFDAFDEEVFIQTGDFFKASLQMAVEHPKVHTIIYTIFFGKAVKMALGFAHTHAAKSELTLKKLAEWAIAVTQNQALAAKIASANTARHAFSFIYPEYPDLMAHVGKKIIESAAGFSNHTLEIRVLMLDFDGQIAFDSAAVQAETGSKEVSHAHIHRRD